MTRIAEAFDAAAERGETALVAYLTAGYPTPDDTVPLIHAAADAGADVVELGVPFTDPMGDGPVIQESSRVALAQGTTIGTVLQLVARARQDGVTVPIVLMGYYNPFLHYGLEQLVKDAAGAGADGFVVPDLPPHMADELRAHAGPAGLATVFFAAPGSADERIRYTAECSTGFLYCLAAEGVTGERAELDPRLTDFLGRVKARARVPLAVGFGISTPAHVRALRGHADGVIVGSALLRRIGAAPDAAGRVAATRELIAELKEAAR
ncbi:tryptophan synthase subunit alpha [Streptomyces sp. NPDC059063]|uniref:tryptophan synthase subunit alpha n=1 Tax=unclassified Streptomyces TaxID=2593676 RepID=UPI003680DF39